MPTVKTTGRVLAVSVLTYVMWKMCERGNRRSYLKKQAMKKRAERDQKRTEQYGDLDFKSLPRGAEIISMTVEELVRSMDEGTLTSEEVVTAYCARAKEAGEVLNTNAEECFIEAIKEAQLCDAERKDGTLRGFLHGVPISIKDQIHMEGYDSTCGLAARVFKPLSYTSVLVTILKDAGAIPFVRSNVPQCLMLPESFNAIWGTACNPFDVSRTPGGSSGGEGALVACGASPLGIGTDIGGSIRIPAGFCGVVGFKPTSQRISAHGMGVPRPNDASGQNAVFSCAGPLAKTVDDVELVMRLWCSEGKTTMWKRDPLVPKMVWDSTESKSTRKLRFGVLRDDGFFTAAPAYNRALNLATEGLKKNGHEVVEIDFDLHRHALLFVAEMSSEGKMRGFLDGLDGEMLHENYSFLKKMADMPPLVRWLVSSVYGLIGKTRMQHIVGEAGEYSVYGFWELIKERDLLKKAFLAYLMKEGIDAVLCPGVGMSALKHGMSTKLSLSCSYAYLWNNFHFPAGSVPVTYVSSGENVYESAFQDPLTHDAKKDIKGAVGLPVNVQIATAPFTDELCLKAMRDVEAAVSSSWRRPNFSHETVLVSKPE